MNLVVVCALSLISPAYTSQQDPNYPIFETDKIPASEYDSRRDDLRKHMGTDSIGVFFTNNLQHRNGDVDYMFRAESNFFYLTGFEESDAALIVVPDGVTIEGRSVKEILFLNAPDQNSLTWLGYRMGSKNAERMLLMDKSFANTEFARVLDEVTAKVRPNKLFGNSPPQGANGQMARMSGAFSTWKTEAGKNAKLQNSWRNFLHGKRGIKSYHELRLLQKSVDISSTAHIEAMKMTAPGMREYEIGGLVKYIFEKNGCEYTGYPPIVGSGPNSTILHYNTNRRLMNDGEMICMDTAGEYHGYTADITRSFPVNGKFSREQKAIYEIVLAATDAGIAACKPGATRGQVGQAISSVLSAGLIKLGIINNARELRQYFMHGWGHNIGLDVHDPQTRNRFEPGITLTVEPGIYIKAGSPCDKKWWNIGIRIEDNVHITAAGPVNMSANCPRTVEEIERTMALKGLGSC